jgi:hypothetical protein
MTPSTKTKDALAKVKLGDIFLIEYSLCETGKWCTTADEKQVLLSYMWEVVSIPYGGFELVCHAGAVTMNMHLSYEAIGNELYMCDSYGECIYENDNHGLLNWHYRDTPHNRMRMVRRVNLEW